MPDRPSRYFAYGSNLHPLRLGLRTPSSRLLGRAMLTGYALRFHKRSDADGSAKADAWRSGDPEDRVLGVVYELDTADFPALDRVEGLGAGGYELRCETVTLAGEDCAVFLYTATSSHVTPALAPWSWYRDLVWQGARWHAMPEAYVEAIRHVPAEPDPDATRHGEHATLIAVMPEWRREHGYRLP